VGATAVAIGWSGYFYNLTAGFGVPYEWTHPPEACQAPGGPCGIINLPAIGIVLLLTFLLSRGAKEAVNLNTIIVIIKLAALAIFIIVALAIFNGNAFSDFQPMGWGGTLTGAAIIFFAFIGFDAVSTAAEEAKNPAKDMKVAIIGSLGIATVVYLLVALTLSGLMAPGFGMAELGSSSSALADALAFHDQNVSAAIVAGGALAAITSVLLVSLYAQPRLFFALARDGLLPARFARLNKRQVPSQTIWVTGLAVAFFSGFVGIGEAAELTNIGTLFAFVLVGYGVLRLRREQPDAPRPFKAPFFPFVPLGAVVMSIALMLSLPAVTWVRFIAWLSAGLLIYSYYGLIHSKVAIKAGMIPPEPAAAPRDEP
jgi:APA family basic amino acid/polyamine antiporter